MTLLTKKPSLGLRKLHLIEGCYHKLYLPEYVAKTANNNELKTEYIRNRGFNDMHFKEMSILYLINK